MSHELRTPLTAILGYAQLMRLQIDAAGMAMLVNDLDVVESSGLHLLQLINSLLDLAKLEAGRMELHIEEFYVNHLIADVVTTAHPLIAKNNNQLQIEQIAGNDLVSGDKTKLYQVLLNLIGNAAKFTNHGTITLRAQRTHHAEHMGCLDLACATSSSPAAQWIRFEISDTGIGIAPDQMITLFDGFTQASSAIAQTYGGTGLGLKISRQLCQSMGGEISAMSEIDRGSTFVVEIPAALGTPLAAVDV
jgi:signal transduction histidine kinase